MGSRTGASYQSIAGSSTQIKKDISVMTTAISTGGDTTASPQISQEQFEIAANIGLKVLLQSQPGITTIFHVIKIGKVLLELYPQIMTAYESGGESAVFELLAIELLKFGIRQGASLILNELCENIWEDYKGENALDSNKSDDQIAKAVINQGISDIISSAKNKIQINESYIYRSVAKRAVREFVVALSESRDEKSRNNYSSDPYSASSLLNQQKRMSLKLIIDAQSESIIEKIISKGENNNISNINSFQKEFIKAYKEVTNEDIPKGFVHKQSVEYEDSSVSIGCNSTKGIKGIALTSVDSKTPSSNDEKKLKISVKKYDKFFENKHIDLINYADGLYRLEAFMRVPKGNKIKRINDFDIHLYSEASKELKFLMRELHITLIGNNKSIKVIKKQKPKEKEKKDISLNETCDTILLFSGGLDSISGYLFEKEKYQNAKFLFVNHGISKLRPEVEKQLKELGRINDLIVVNTNTGGDYLQQTRGFLFITIAAVFADLLNAKKIVVSECGVTKYHPSESIADEITKTTHPHMIDVAKNIYHEFGIDVKIYFPFDNNTKTEIIAKCGDYIDLLKRTVSCRIGTRKDIMNKKECGYCMACVMKLISLSYYTGEKQDIFFLDPLTHSIGDSETDARITQWKLNNQRTEALFSTIKFCSEILSNNLRSDTKRTLEGYNRYNLFYRYSEDMIYGLWFMKEKNMIKNKLILTAINNIEQQTWFDKKRAIQRRVDLTSQTNN